jgi:hypothetical protein
LAANFHVCYELRIVDSKQSVGSAVNGLKLRSIHGSPSLYIHHPYLLNNNSPPSYEAVRAVNNRGIFLFSKITKWTLHSSLTSLCGVETCFAGELFWPRSKSGASQSPQMLQLAARAGTARKEAGKCGKKVQMLCTKFVRVRTKDVSRDGVPFGTRKQRCGARNHGHRVCQSISPGLPKGKAQIETPHKGADEGTKSNIPIHSAQQHAAPY